MAKPWAGERRRSLRRMANGSAAGIGYELLRLADQRLPSGLLWE